MTWLFALFLHDQNIQTSSICIAICVDVWTHTVDTRISTFQVHSMVNIYGQRISLFLYVILVNFALHLPSNSLPVLSWHAVQSRWFVLPCYLLYKYRGNKNKKIGLLDITCRHRPLTALWTDQHNVNCVYVTLYVVCTTRDSVLQFKNHTNVSNIGHDG